MQITINIEESQLQEVMDQQLKALDSDYLGEIVAKAIEEYFRLDNYKNVEKLIFKVPQYYNSSVRDLTPLMSQAVANADYSGLQDVVDAAIDQLKKNYSQILICAVSDMITRSIVDSQSISDKIRFVAAEETCNILNSSKG